MRLNKSEAIRQLLEAEPGITPARLRDTLAIRGIEVDTHLIKVVRANYTRTQKAARELARQLEEEAQEKAIHAWKWWWLIDYQMMEGYSPRRIASMKAWSEQQKTLRQGGIIPEEELLDFPEIPDLTELYIDLLFMIHAGEMTYVRALSVARSILDSHMD